MPRLRALAALALAAVAATACTTPYRPGVPYYIEDVTVRAAPETITPETAQRIEATIEAQAARAPREGEPKQLDVTVTSFRTKNPALSLLVGDTNRMQGTATITGAGVTEWSETVMVTSDAILQGISGAIIAAMRKREGIERELGDRLAVKTAKAAYGGKLPDGRRRARTAPAEPATPVAPAAPAAPVAPGVADGVVAGV